MTELSVIVCLAFDHRASTAGLKKFKDCIFHCPFVEIAMEVSGSFDLIVHARLSSLAEYTEQMDFIREELAQYVVRMETNFVSKRISAHLDEEERALWVPCDGGRKRIDTIQIDKVVAEGDYMRLFVGQWTCLLHETIRNLRQRLGPQFIQLHRSILVRVDFIDRLLHQERRWVARLCDGSEHRVAKSHVAEVVHLIQGDLTTGEPVPAKQPQPDENPQPVNEMVLPVLL